MKCFYFDDEYADLGLIAGLFELKIWPEVRRIVQDEYFLDDPGKLEIERKPDGEEAVAQWRADLDYYDILMVDLIDAKYPASDNKLIRGAELAALARENQARRHAIIAISRAEQSQKHIGWARRQFEEKARLKRPGYFGTSGYAFINKAELLKEYEESYVLKPDEVARILIPVLIDTGVLDTRVSTSRLKFDPKNPRLEGIEWGEKEPTETEILSLYWDELDAEELAASIAEHGYWKEEPLYVERGTDGKLMVKEGNRRLAAVKGLLDSSSHPKAAAILVSNPNLKHLERLPVLSAEGDLKVDFDKFIAFRHLNSNMRWGTYARARYIAEAVNEKGEGITKLAARVGDTFGTVRMLYRAYQVLDQAERNKLFERSHRANFPGKLAFAQLVFGLQRPGVVDFLGMAEAKDDARDPVPPSYYDNLRLLMLWVFGDRHQGAEPVILGDEEDWSDLEQVLLDESAVLRLKAGSLLSEVMEELRPASARITTLLASAEQHLHGVEHLLGQVNQTTVLHQDIASSLEKLAGRCAGVARQVADHGQKPSVTG